MRVKAFCKTVGAVLLSFAMVLGGLPVTVLAEGDIASDAGEVISLEEPTDVQEEIAAVEPEQAGDQEEPVLDEVVALDDEVELEEELELDEAAPVLEEEEELASKDSSKWATKPSVAYYVHRQTYGDEKPFSKRDGDQSGTTGQSKRLEAIYIKLVKKPVSGGIQYRTHVQSIGWQGWKKDGAMSGTSRRALRLEAIQIKLSGQMAKQYDVYYRVHAQKFGWMGWAKNGASSGTAGYGYRLESIQIVLVSKGGKAPATTFRGASRNTSAAFKDKTPITVKGNGWKAELPSYWRGKAKVANWGSSSQYLYDISATEVMNEPKYCHVFEISASSYKFAMQRLKQKAGTVKLKNGTQVTVYKDNYDVDVMGGFFVKLKNGNYLQVSAPNFRANPYFYYIVASGGSAGSTFRKLSSSEIATLGKLQTLGRSTYGSSKTDWSVPLACMQAVASGLTIN